MIGYGVTGYLISGGTYYQVAFQIQAFCLVFSCVVLCFIPHKLVDASANQEQEIARPSSPLDIARAWASVRSFTEVYGWTFVGANGDRLTGQSFSRQDSQLRLDNRPLNGHCTRSSSIIQDGEVDVSPRHSGVTHESMCSQLKMLLTNGMFLSTCLGLCALFYVVTGVQYWSSKFFQIAFHRPEAEVTSVYIFMAGSSPLAGVVAGSTIIDRCGGYSNPKSVKKSCGIVFFWACLAGSAAVIAAAVNPVKHGLPGAAANFYGVVLCIFTLLFFGAAMLPAATGILLASVPERFRSFSSAVANVAYNLLGYAMGAYLPGQISHWLFSDADLDTDAQKMKIEVARTRVNFVVTLAGSVPAVIGCFGMYLLSRRAAAREEARTVLAPPSEGTGANEVESNAAYAAQTRE